MVPTIQPPTPTTDEMEAVFDRLQELEWGFAWLVILQSAQETGLLTWLAGQETPCTAQEAAAALSLHPEATRKVLSALGGMDLLEVFGAGERFHMRPGARPLFDEGSEVWHGAGLSHLFRLSQRWAESLPDWLRTGEFPRPTRGPDETAAFIQAMRSLAHGSIGRLAQILPLEGAHHLLDLGGALGTYAIELCLRNPALRATVLDVPAVISHTEEEIARHGLADRVAAVAGSYLESPLPAADVVLLSNVLHQEHRAQAARLVSRAVDALEPGGRLVVVDFTLEADRCHPISGSVFAVNMRLFGDTYSVPDLVAFLTEAGLVNLHRVDLSPNKLAMTGVKP